MRPLDARDTMWVSIENAFTYICLGNTTALYAYTFVSGPWEFLCERGVHDVDHRLPGTFGDGFKSDQKHIVQVHEPLANLQPPGSGFGHGVWSRLRFNV